MAPKLIRWVRNYHIQMNKLTAKLSSLNYEIEAILNDDTDVSFCGSEWEVSEFEAIRADEIKGDIDDLELQLEAVKLNIQYLEAELAIRLDAEGL